jgi:hypothetical protein
MELDLFNYRLGRADSTLPLGASTHDALHLCIADDPRKEGGSTSSQNLTSRSFYEYICLILISIHQRVITLTKSSKNPTGSTLKSATICCIAMEIATMAAGRATRTDPTFAPVATLADGTRIRLELIGPADRADLLSGFEGLSRRSRYLRFFSAMPTLSAHLVDSLLNTDPPRRDRRAPHRRQRPR